jgi:hypothetical protein
MDIATAQASYRPLAGSRRQLVSAAVLALEAARRQAHHSEVVWGIPDTVLGGGSDEETDVVSGRRRFFDRSNER